jgi:hypothetical protein
MKIASEFIFTICAAIYELGGMINSNSYTDIELSCIPNQDSSGFAPCSLGLSATSQQYFSLRTNQPPAISRNQPAVLFSQNQSAPAISHQPTEQALGWS